MKVIINNKLKLEAQVNAKLDRFIQQLSTELLDAAAEINTRTATGKMIEGSTFPGYAEFTKKKKRMNKGGRSKQTNPVNLTETGKMLTAANKIKITKTNNAIIGIIRFSDKASAEKGKWNQQGDPKRNRPARPWFGLSNQQKTGIIRRLTGK